jgi:hypothetical protein
VDGTEQFQMKKQLVYERMMHSPMIASLAYMVSADLRGIPDHSDLTRLISKTLRGIAYHSDQIASIKPYVGLD